MTSKPGKPPSPMSYMIKGTRMRTEMKTEATRKRGPETTISIVDWETREVIMLMTAQRKYMVTKIPEAVVEKVNDSAAKQELKPTGRRERIAGYMAEEYAGVSEKKWTEMWVTGELGSIMSAGLGNDRGKPSAWEQFLITRQLFALRVITRAKPEAAENFRLEVVKIKETSLSPELFVAPEGYTKFEMPGFGDLLKGMAP